MFETHLIFGSKTRSPCCSARSSSEDVIGFEMERAGTWNRFPTVVVKSACDYSDSHKNKVWQDHAVATAALCAKAVLEEWETSDQASASAEPRSGGT